MSEFSAFLAGLILGDTAPLPKNITHKTSMHSNIALQDVAFCQALRNVIDGLEEYVQTKHPSPQEFIRHLLPGEDFKEPYTDDERKIIADNQHSEKEYIKWISSRLHDGARWEDFDAMQMIWDDRSHTPDPDNLDLLFGDSLLSKPLKRGGRVYEYNTTVPLSGLAKGFFETIPAKIILRLCLTVAQGTVSRYGYQYDYTRFEYNSRADKSGSMEQWKANARSNAYLQLLHDSPWFCKSAWSKRTSVLRDIDEYNNTEPLKLDKTEATRRKDEAKKIYATLSPSELKSYSVWSIRRKSNAVANLFFVVFVAIAIIAFVLAFGLSMSNAPEAANIALYVALSALGVLGITCVSVMFSAVFSKKHIDERVLDYITVIQASYYNKTDDSKARQYAELLKRI